MTRSWVHSRRFTLIELLVVMAIVLTLLSLLTPVLTAALRLARQTVCTGNLKQIGGGLLLYADEHDGYSFAAQPPEPIGHWLNYLYVDMFDRDPRVLRCPALANDDLFNPWGGTGPYAQLTRASYLMNIVREADVRGWSSLPAAISTPYNRSFGWTQGTAAQPLRLAHVRNPDAKIAIADSAPDLRNTATACGVLRMTETDHGRIDSNANGETNAGERQVGWQHDQRFNALFGDAHVESRLHSTHEEWNVHQLP